jgi:DNA-binding XRE family transcriptional regulator
MRGYSLRIADAVRDGDDALPWVKLGKMCIDRGIPVDTVAKELEVSRQSVYAWFLGRSTPGGDSLLRITAYLDSLS